MAQIVRFKRLNDDGWESIDLDSCPLQFVISELEEDEHLSVFYRISHGRWVHHHVYDCPYDGRVETLQEVTPYYAAQELDEAELKLSPDLKAQLHVVRASQKGWN